MAIKNYSRSDFVRLRHKREYQMASGQIYVVGALLFALGIATGLLMAGAL